MIDALLGQVRNTALIVGIIALVGLILQKKSIQEIVSGTTKTILGFMIFNVGSTHLGIYVSNFTTLFNTAFGIEGVTTQVEIATALALDVYGTEVALVMVLGFAFNLLFAKFTPFKAIFLTGQHFLYFACVLALVLIAGDLPMYLVIILGGILLGFFGAALPTLCQPFMNKLIGNDTLAMGHFNCIGYALSGYIGKLFTKSNTTTDNIKLPKFFELFRDFIFSIAVFMVVLFYIVTIACMVTGQNEIVYKLAGNDLWFLMPLFQGLQFAAGMSVLIYGVRQFIAEITTAFVAISEKYIPNSKPAVDCPAIFPFAPNAVIIGFIGAFLGGTFATFMMVMLKSPVIMIPAAGICFFSGGTSGVFGSVYGGWKGALLGSFIVGISLTALPLILYPAFSALGIAGASFPNVDYNIVGSIIFFIQNLFGLV